MRKQRPSQSTIKTPEQDVQAENAGTEDTPERQRNTSRRSPTGQRTSLRAGLAVVSGRAAGAISRRLHLGGGTSIVGVVAQRMYPSIVEHLAQQLEHGNLIITGTNGKTTTSSFIAAILADAGLRVWRNREGSNLMRGVASSLVIRALPNGQLRRSGRAIAVLEVDEAVLPQVVQIVHPRVAIFTNLFRDQLDRYGEVDSVMTYWQKAVDMLPESTTLVLNADDPSVASLGISFSGRVLYYGIEDVSLNIDTQDDAGMRHQVIDTRTCPGCGSDFEYNVRFYSHMGHYHCPNCNQHRPQPAVRAVQICVDDLDRLRIQVASSLSASQQQEIVIPLPGIYNTYNALAAITAAQALDIEWKPIVSGIEQSKPVFGRGERIQVDGRTIRLLLAKNPTGFNEVLRTLFHDMTKRYVLFVLNSNIADGQDISWIWDVDFERCAGQTEALVIAGDRALDLALRLKYAGIAEENMIIVPPAALRAARQDERNPRQGKQGRETPEAEITKEAEAAEIREVSQTSGVNETKLAERHIFGLKKAIDVALQHVPEGETLFIVPTYTGLLEVHRELEQRGLTAHYWEGRDA